MTSGLLWEYREELRVPSNSAIIEMKNRMSVLDTDYQLLTLTLNQLYQKYSWQSLLKWTVQHRTEELLQQKRNRLRTITGLPTSHYPFRVAMPTSLSYSYLYDIKRNLKCENCNHNFTYYSNNLLYQRNIYKHSYTCITS